MASQSKAAALAHNVSGLQTPARAPEQTNGIFSEARRPGLWLSFCVKLRERDEVWHFFFGPFVKWQKERLDTQTHFVPSKGGVHTTGTSG